MYLYNRQKYEGQEGESSTEPQWGGSVNQGGDRKKTTPSTAAGAPMFLF